MAIPLRYNLRSIGVRRTGTLMAVLSPGPEYATANANADAMLAWHYGGRSWDRPTCSTYGPNVEKADAILRTGDLSILSGPKVTAYFRNIMGEWQHVTLDRHAVRPISKLGKDTPTGKVERARMEAAYREAEARGEGAATLDGAMIDVVVLRMVKTTLDKAALIGM